MTHETRIHYTAPNPYKGCVKPRIPRDPQVFPVVIVEGKHPVPYRTRSLSLPTPMVLHEGSCGRVGHCRNTFPVCGMVNTNTGEHSPENACQ